MAGMLKAVQAIPGEPLPHGILTSGCADVQDVGDIHELLGVEWLALGCCPVGVWRDPCLDDESPGLTPDAAPPQKEFCRPRTEHAEPITVYAGAECSALGWSYAEARAHAEASLALGEQQAVESGFWTGKLAMDGIDLTPSAGPVPIAQGVATLEGCLAQRYGGRGVLHVPAGAAALLGCCNLVHEDPAGGTPRTLAGNCVVIGAGYSAAHSGPGNLPAPAGTAWLYITGPLVIRRGPAETLPDQNASVNTRTNDRRVLVERTYVVATTCTVCAIQVVTSP
jgi:hypothetical protein